MPSSHDLVTFIDNYEDRIVIEVDAEWAEQQFSSWEIWEQGLFAHLGLPVNWTIFKVEYTGESYIVTFTRLWV